MKSSFKTPILSLACATLFLHPLSTLLAQDGEATDVRVTHGPLLGRPGPDTMSLWVRTEKPGEVKVFYGYSYVTSSSSFKKSYYLFFC